MSTTPTELGRDAESYVFGEPSGAAAVWLAARGAAGEVSSREF